MFDSQLEKARICGGTVAAGADTAGAAGADEFRTWVDHLAASNLPERDAALVDEIEALERVRAAAAARQAGLTAALSASQEDAQRASGAAESEVGRGIAGQVGLARHDSPNKAVRHVGLAKALVAEMPHTLAALRRGDTSEWQATLMVRETAHLSLADRQAVDAAVGPRLSGYGDQRTWAEARKHAYRLDPEGAIRRVRGAEADRTVTLRPAPETMTRLTGFLPVKQGVGAFASLTRHADAAKAQGDTRSRGQILADEFARRLTGQSTPDSTDAEIVVITSADTLFAGPTDEETQEPTTDEETGEPTTDPDSRGPVPDPSEEPGHLHGHGPVPAWWVRTLARDTQAKTWIRRAFAAPSTGELVALESRRRLFPGGLKRALIIRDQTCRTPWCDAPIRHADHVQSFEDGGQTSLANGQGLCAACNWAKQAPGWTAQPLDHARVVRITTPTGHIYDGHAPPLPGGRQRPGLRRARHLRARECSHPRPRLIRCTPRGGFGRLGLGP